MPILRRFALVGGHLGSVPVGVVTLPQHRTQFRHRWYSMTFGDGGSRIHDLPPVLNRPFQRGIAVAAAVRLDRQPITGIVGKAARP